jgi:hypothetical protein
MPRNAFPAPRSRAAIATGLVALALMPAFLGGCARRAEPQQAGVSQLWNVAPAKLTLMTPAEKASQISTSFPPQVPVPSGDVQRGEAQGDSAWDYVIVVPGSVDAVTRWYMESYINAEWSVVSRSASVITLEKNSAQSRLEFAKAGDSPAKTKVTASVGVGTPILQTQ